MLAGAAEKINLLGFDRDALSEFFVGLGEKPFRARQLVQWIHRRGVVDFAEMTDLATALRRRLDDCAELPTLPVLREQISRDGTIKWLLGVADGNAVETVFIPEAGRGTLCISSQVGCMLNCTFCSTAQQGFKRNLSSAEIVGQVFHTVRYLERLGCERRRVTNVVFMGMGEPMLNLKAVSMALSLLRDECAYGLAARRVTVSTAGVVPGIDALSQGVEFALAVSLHAPVDELRNRLVPLNRKYPLDDLLAACKRYTRAKAKRSVTFEYTMIDGLNDDPRLARLLVKRLNGLPCKINLIPFNPFPGAVFAPSSDEAIDRFQQLTRSAGIITTVRKTRGEDIDAACGQLVGQLAEPSPRRRLVQQRLARAAVALA